MFIFLVHKREKMKKTSSQLALDFLKNRANRISPVTKEEALPAQETVLQTHGETTADPWENMKCALQKKSIQTRTRMAYFTEE